MSRAVALIPFILLVATAASAQAGGNDRSAALAVEAGRVIAFEDARLQAGIRISPRDVGVGSVDGAFTTFPGVIADGGFLFMVDLDGTFGWPVGGDDVGVFPRAGISAIAGGGAAVGYNLGIGVLVRLTHKVGTRVDYTHRRFLTGGDVLPFSSITAGIALLF